MQWWVRRTMCPPKAPRSLDDRLTGGLVPACQAAHSAQLFTRQFGKPRGVAVTLGFVGVGSFGHPGYGITAAAVTGLNPEGIGRFRGFRWLELALN
jgi:hypothetical protein